MDCREGVLAIIITGASGHIGSHVAELLTQGDMAVVSISRNPLPSRLSGVTQLRGDFTSCEDLRQLDPFRPEAVVHLAAVLGTCSEREAIAVNVEGTRVLFRYAIDRGCRKFVFASSIAAVGCLRTDFLPAYLPIDEKHPRMVADPYGLSKAIGEDVAAYFHRRSPDVDVTCLRFGFVKTEAERMLPLATPSKPIKYPFIEMACLALEDAVDAVEAALSVGHRPGTHIYNVVGSEASSKDEPLRILRAQFGSAFQGVDVSRYLAGNPRAPLYSIGLIERELGFTPRIPVRGG